MLKKTAGILLFAFLPLVSVAQFDLTISPSVVAPVSGCQLSSNAVVTIIVVNAQSSPYSGTFDISYSLNGGAPVVESVTAFLPGSATYIYSFTVTADLSACQIHTFDFEVDDPTDINDLNDYLSITVTSDCPADAGDIIVPTEVCVGINSGNMVSWGYIGNIEGWSQSTDGGATWTSIPNTTATQPYSNITTPELWYVIVGSLYGYCDDDTTDIKTIDTVAQTIPGTLPPDFDICDNGNGGQIDLTGNLGNVLNWEISTDNGTTWTVISNTTSSLNYWNLMDTTMYQVQVQHSICPPDYTAPVTLTLIPGSDAGSIVGELLVCNFENDSSLEVNPAVGGVFDWIISTDNATTFVSTGVTDTILPYTGLMDYTVFAAIIQEANCPFDTAYHSIVVLPLALTATPTTTIFEGESVQLNASGGISFLWYPDTFMDDPTISNPIVTPEFTMTYYVEITDISGCADTTSLIITVATNPTTIVIPNLLTPNADTFNDILVITNIDTYPLNELIIFNSYGQLIYQASPYNNDWDASYNGSAVPDGTYYYVLDLHDPVLAPDPIQGVITILGNE